MTTTHLMKCTDISMEVYKINIMAISLLQVLLSCNFGIIKVLFTQIGRGRFTLSFGLISVFSKLTVEPIWSQKQLMEPFTTECSPIRHVTQVHFFTSGVTFSFHGVSISSQFKYDEPAQISKL